MAAEGQQSEAELIIVEVDQLHTANQWRECYDYVRRYGDSSEDVELLWRVVRSHYYVGKHLARDREEKDTVAKAGLEVNQRALKLHDNHFALQKWSGIFLSWASEVGGTKSKIEKSFVVKEHFEKAISLNSSDPLVKHLLGRWCYEVASVSWTMRQLARAIFAAPPVSSYDEALKYFQEAEETVPGFFPGNWLYLAKTHYQLSNKPEAKKWVTKVLDHKVVNKEDEGHQKEATQLLQRL